MSAVAQTFPSRPGQHDFIADEAHLIGSEDAAAVRSIAEALLADAGIPVVVVTIPSLDAYGGADIRSYAESLFNEWGIGSQKNNRAILLLVSAGDRKARIELGRDWGTSQDAACHRIMQDVMTPAFRQSGYSSGIRDGVEALADMARRANRVNVAIHWLKVAGFLALIAIGVSLIRAGKAGWGWAMLAGAAVWLFQRSGDDDDGGSFDGGSSGGGGDTGSW